MRVALAPLLTDVPIIVLSLLVLRSLASSDAVLGGIGLAGAAYVLILGIDTLGARPAPPIDDPPSPASLRRGVVVNALSPHPYLFWISVGGPYVVRALGEAPASAWAFVAGFYGCLVGAKVLVALLAGRFRGWLEGAAYRLALRLLGALLVALAVGLLRDAGALLGWW
jgi:threonine/homoserine/homoserine lactone efflux protein